MPNDKSIQLVTTVRAGSDGTAAANQDAANKPSIAAGSDHHVGPQSVSATGVSALGADALRTGTS